jgi:hypothetical protein
MKQQTYIQIDLRKHNLEKELNSLIKYKSIYWKLNNAKYINLLNNRIANLTIILIRNDKLLPF